MKSRSGAPARSIARAPAIAALLLGVAASAPAAAATPASATPKTHAAKAPVASPVSPHARAARQRALARAEAQGSPMMVSPYGATRKPHKPVQPH
ncbi:MAG: hypothetical protein JSR73_15255 [Proteobacteria bacterium]|nr:hypothetical protein [Pseudomonadota bacterium]